MSLSSLWNYRPNTGICQGTGLFQERGEGAAVDGVVGLGKEDEADEGKARVAPDKADYRGEGHPGGLLYGVAVRACAYGREGDGPKALVEGYPEARRIGALKEPGLVVEAVLVYGPDRVDDVPGPEVAARCKYRAAGRADAYLSAFLHYRRAAGPVDGPLNAPAPAAPPG